jgi:PTS system fructose-specific IIC component/PTS system nitrogen regulatory IIA component
MRLQDIFTPQRIILDLRSREKNAVFRELADRLAESYGISEKEKILEAVQLREKKMSTGIQKGIAIPHGKSSVVPGVSGVIGISRSGIDYDALDGEPVHLLFFLVSPEGDPKTHLDVLKDVAHLLEIPDFFPAVMKADSPSAVAELFGEYDSKNLRRERPRE